MNKNFFRISDTKKIKILLRNQCSPFNVVRMSFLSYDCNLLGTFPRKTIFGMSCALQDRDSTRGCSVLLINNGIKKGQSCFKRYVWSWPYFHLAWPPWRTSIKLSTSGFTLYTWVLYNTQISKNGRHLSRVRNAVSQGIFLVT